MRELKFRAWNLWKEGPTLMDWDELMSMSMDGVFGDEAYGNGSLVLEQYTGLVDRHGKEIYEGDIVKITHISWKDTPDERIEHVFASDVWWSDFYASFCYTEPGDDYHAKTEPMMFNSRSMEIEIIGNIHENPNLLDADATKHHE